MNNQNELKQFNLLQIILYHLLPGLPMLLLIIVFANPTWGLGWPVLISLLLAAALGALPAQVGILFFTARKQGKKIRDLIGFTEKMPLLKTIGWAAPCLAFALFAFMVLAPLEHPLWTIFNWVPDWFRADRFNPATAERFLLILSIILNFAINGLFGPFVEEIYFRGYLLPRMNKLGTGAPFVNAVLFSLYHMFTPWENITRILVLTPMIYIVWKKRNIRIALWFHCTLNILSCIGMLFML